MGTISLLIAVACAAVGVAYWRRHTAALEQPLSQGGRSSVRPRPRKSTKGNLGFALPEGRFTAALASPDRGRLEAALADISALAVAGDPAGIEELEAFVQANSARPVVEFLRRVPTDPGLKLRPQEALLDLARRGSLFDQVVRAQTALTALAREGQVNEAVRALRRIADERRAREAELLYAQLTLRARYWREGVHSAHLSA